MSYMLQPTIVLLKEGTDSSQGRGQLISNINACEAVVDAIRTTLGPRGMDKLLYNQRGDVTISNDGATVLSLLNVVHPAAQILVNIAKSQDAEVGDGTTSVVILAGEFLKEAKTFIEDGVHPTIIMKGYREACRLARARIGELAVSVKAGRTDEELRELLRKCASTALNSKLIASKREHFAKLVVDAVMRLDDDMDMDLIGIKKVKGGGMDDSYFVEGVAFKKTFSYAGFEQQPKRIENPRILLLNIELELKREKDNAEIRITDPAKYQELVSAEWNVIYSKLDAILASGANVIFSKLAIGDLATQYFADHGVFSAGRVADADLIRLGLATGAKVQTTVRDLVPSANPSPNPNVVLGTCLLFEEKQMGGERYNFLTGCPQARSATIILRGGGEQFIDETERSVHDAMMVVRRARKNAAVVGGGGAIEMEISRYLRDFSRTIHGKLQLVINAYAKALEVIPRQVAENAGFDSTDLLNKLRMQHARGGVWMGVDIEREGEICDTIESFVWEPTVVKLNALASATEAACLVLSVDETVKNPRAGDGQDHSEIQRRGF